MRCVAVINQKGGVGKTTTTVNHGAALARYGKRVLLLDLDPQGNLSLHLDRRPGPDQGTMTDLLADGAPLESLIRDTATPGLSVVPADTSLAGVEQLLADRIGRETVLREALDRLRGSDRFDYVLMDCPPSLGVLAANALVAADEVLIPLQPEYFALQGMAKLLEVIELVQRRLNPTLDVGFVLPCMVDLRTRLANEVLDEVRRHFGDRVSPVLIRTNVKLAESPSFGRTIFEHAPQSNGAIDHDAFARAYLSAREGSVPDLVAEAPPVADEDGAAEAETREASTAEADEASDAPPTSGWPAAEPAPEEARFEGET